MVSEEAVEAAYCEIPDGAGRYIDQSDIRLMLEAAAPHIAAQALEEAADAFDDLPVNNGATISSGTFDWFELFPVQHIRDRAEWIKCGASPLEPLGRELG